MYHRSRFTPRRWNSEDGRYSYYMSESGAIDILPGPKSKLMEWLYEAYPEYKNPSPKKPFSSGSAHIHWAYDKNKEI